MRIRNGEDFLRASIESHIHVFDEIVAVHNGCTDRSEEILTDLREKFPKKIRVFHYEPKVYPVGSEGHIKTDKSSIHSIANYYNWALARTRFKIATKLDDDHICIPDAWSKILDRLRRTNYNLKREMPCFSGINLLWKNGVIGISKKIPFAGNGDHFLFEVNKNTYFSKNRKFEVFRRGNLRRSFCGLFYLHCKFLKHDFGFSNYELNENPNSRYHKQLDRFLRSEDTQSLNDLIQSCKSSTSAKKLISALLSCFSSKAKIKQARREALKNHSIKENISRAIKPLMNDERFKNEKFIF